MRKPWRPTLAERAGLAERTLAWIVGLSLIAALTQWLVWLQREPEAVSQYVGPPRSDYELGPFTMNSFDDEGKFAFALNAPRLVRHPYLHTYSVDLPKILIHDKQSNDWRTDSKQAWISKDGKEIRLSGDVVANRVPTATATALTVRSERLTALTDKSQLLTDTPVVITEPGSILSGTGLDADLKQGRFVLQSQVKGHYVAPAKK